MAVTGATQLGLRDIDSNLGERMVFALCQLGSSGWDALIKMADDSSNNSNNKRLREEAEEEEGGEEEERGVEMVEVEGG